MSFGDPSIFVLRPGSFSHVIFDDYCWCDCLPWGSGKVYNQYIHVHLTGHNIILHVPCRAYSSSVCKTVAVRRLREPAQDRAVQEAIPQLALSIPTQ